MNLYFANFTANNGTSWVERAMDTNKERLIRKVRFAAEANRQEGNRCEWYVTDSHGHDVAIGGVGCNGKRYRLLIEGRNA